MLFLNSFMSYLLVVIIFGIIAVGGVLVGKFLRKRKDEKTELLQKDKTE
ncbi:MAG: hypothetical protein RR364_07780 [Lachnospiraceae bacterium]